MKASSSKRCQFLPGKRDQIPEPNNSNCITPMQIDLYFLGLQVPGEITNDEIEMPKMLCSLSFDFSPGTIHLQPRAWPPRRAPSRIPSYYTEKHFDKNGGQYSKRNF